MRTFIVLPDYEDAIHLTKDPGIIVQLLIEKGYKVQMVCSRGSNAIPSLTLSSERINSGEWLPDEACNVIIYHGGKGFWKLMKQAKCCGHRVIIKADTDGHLFKKIWNPFSPEMPGILREPEIKMGALLRHWRHLLFLQGWAKRRGFFDADVITVESDSAMKAIQQALPALSDKLRLIPNGAFFDRKDKTFLEKDSLILAVGRWDDQNAKNPQLLFRVLQEEAFRLNKKWTCRIVGPYDASVKKIYEALPDQVKERIDLCGSASNEAVLKEMEKAKILISTSRWEGFPLVGVEALSQGCSLVCTPTGMAMQTGNGLLGTCASDWQSKTIAKALAEEMLGWENGRRCMREIIAEASKRFDWQVIINSLGALLGEKQGG